MRILHFSLVFWQVALLFAGCFWRDYNSVVTMYADEPGESLPRSLRGFRRRWSERSAASESHGVSPHELTEQPGNVSFDFMDDVASEQLDGFGAFDSWMHIPECAADGTADSYEPESPVETLQGDAPALKVFGPSQVEHAWQQCAMAAQSKRRKLVQPKLPWEHSPFNLVFRTGGRWHGTALANLSDMFQPAGFGVADVLNSDLVDNSTLARKFEAPAPPVVQLNFKQTRKELPDEDIRRVALCKLRHLLLQDPLATQLGVSIKSMLDSACHPSVAEQSISDCFRMKASSTLQKRASSLWRLEKLLRGGGVLNPLRITEQQLYSALCELQEGSAGATSAQHMLEALFFLDSTAQLILVDLRQVASGRCRGVARDMFLKKHPLEQKRPLTLANVQFLETLYHHLPNSMKCILGQLLFCIHSCCRWKDAQRLQGLWAEKGHGETLIHADALSLKTALSAEARTRFLPYVALGSGVNGHDWGADWIESRMLEGLEFEHFSLPSFSERSCSWTGNPMSASEATYWLREFLGSSLEPFNAHWYGSHSCKTTLLTWAGRCVQVSFSPTERRLLGHHLEPSMKSILKYSGESYTALYSKVLLMFRCMRSGEYDPDLPAIDRVVQLSDASLPQQSSQDDDKPSDVFHESDPESSVASECGLVGEEAHRSAAASSSDPTSLFPNFPGVPESSLLVHRVSNLVHAMNEDGFLLCGRQPSLNFKPYSAMLSDRKLCEGCAQCKRAFTSRELT